MILLFVACVAGPDPREGSISGDRWSHAGLHASLALPAEGRWSVDPADFASGLSGVLLEGHLDGVDLAAVGHTPGYWLAPRLADATALDVLLLLAPPARPEVPVTRLQGCGDAVFQALEGMDRLARRAGAVEPSARTEGLLVLYAWGGDAPARWATLARVACGAGAGGRAGSGVDASR